MELLYKLAPVLFGLSGLFISIIELIIGPMWVNYPLWYIVTPVRTIIFVIAGICFKKLYDRGLIDSLTGLFNRRYFEKKLSEEIERIKRSKQALSLIMIDVDDFKKVNDTYGHRAGDEVLKFLAAIFKKNTRVIDTVARWGGEEFTIILPFTGIEGALVLAERLRQIVEMSPAVQNTTISQGIVSSSIIADPDDFVMKADNALYKAKQRKNAIETAGEQM